jgi:hypothetical protein
MDTDESGCTIIYATGKPMIGFVDFCARRRLPPLPVTASVSAVRIAPGGTLLAVTRTGVRILRLGGDGKVRQSYGARGVTGWSAIDLTSDGTGFWAASKAGRLYRFALASGAVTATIDSPPVAALAVVGAPRLALPQIATPAAPAHLALDGVPTLTGEGLSGVENPPAASPSPCSETSASTITFQSHGQTIGPYTGSYDASTDLAIGGEARAGATGWPGLPPRVLSGVHGTFSIDSEVGRVTGTIELPRAAASDIGSCAIFTGRSFPNSFIVPPVETFSGYFWNAYAPTLAYSAQIESNGKTYTDSGSAVLSADLFDIFRTSGQLAGAGKQYHASFSSSEVAVDDRFQSTATSVSHAAAVPLATPALRVVLRWRDARDSFKLANVRLAPTSKRSLAKTRPGKLRITKLRITVVRTRTSLNATVSNLRAGQLSFTVQPQRLSRATTVQTAVAGTRR